MEMQTLIPELPPELTGIVMQYFDNFWSNAPGYATRNSVDTYQEFEDRVKPTLPPRSDDADLFDGCRKLGELYDVFQGQGAINGILGQLYCAGMSFHPCTLTRIAINGGEFADWIARTFFMKIHDLGFQLGQQIDIPTLQKLQRFCNIINESAEKHRGHLTAQSESNAR